MGEASQRVRQEAEEDSMERTAEEWSWAFRIQCLRLTLSLDFLVARVNELI